jgi:hypothetical protein
MNLAGYPCGHEEAWGIHRFVVDGQVVPEGHRRGERFIPSRRHESSWMAVGSAEDYARVYDVEVIHVTREPKKVYESFVNGGTDMKGFTGLYARRMVDLFPELPWMHDPIQAWIGWVYGKLEFAESWDVSEGAEVLAERLCIDPKPLVRVEKLLPKNVNTRGSDDELHG